MKPEIRHAIFELAKRQLEEFGIQLKAKERMTRLIPKDPNWKPGKHAPIPMKLK